METILVVDDEAQVRALARDILVGAGYRVLEAEDGETALQVSMTNGLGKVKSKTPTPFGANMLGFIACVARQTWPGVFAEVCKKPTA